MSNNSNKVRLDIRTRYFCELEKQSFFDLRVFNSNPCGYHNSSLQQYHVTNEQERNRTCNERILQIDHGTLNQQQWGKRVAKFYSHLAQMISEKRNLPLSISSNWIGTKVCFVLLNVSLLCLRKLRVVCRRREKFEIDVDVSHTVAKI